MILFNKQTLPNYIIEFMSNEWIVNSSAVLAGILFFLVLGRTLSRRNNVMVSYVLGAIMFFSSVIMPLWSAFSGQFNIVTDLPLHLCGISGLICSVLPFLKRKQFLYDFVFYSGIIGGIASILTPQMNSYDGSLFVYIEYYVRHGLILLIPLFMFRNLNIQPTKYSTLKTFLILNILLCIIMPINFYLGSNYMYLAEPPQVNNPLIVGEWPYYLLWFEVFVLGLMAAFYAISKIKLSRIY